MSTVKSYSLKNMSDATARDDGAAVKFAFQTHSGEILECECGVDAIPLIVARLTAAMEQAAVISQPKGKPVVSQAIIAEQVEVAIAKGHAAILTTLFVTPHCAIPFSMTPELAERVSTGLATAVAKVRPAKKPGALS